MSQFDKFDKVMQKRLKKSRYKHTLGVVETAKRLAKKHGANVESAALAALLHDYGKYVTKDDLLKLAKKYGIHVDEVVMDSPALLHGEVGAELVCKDLGVCDEDVLNAIRFHTYGRMGMSKLEKIIYIADAIEPGRDYPGVDDLRRLADENLDLALKRALSDSIKFVTDKVHTLHYNTIKLWNDLVIKNSKE